MAKISVVLNFPGSQYLFSIPSKNPRFYYADLLGFQSNLHNSILDWCYRNSSKWRLSKKINKNQKNFQWFTFVMKLKDAKSSKVISLHSTILLISLRVTKLNFGLFTLKNSITKFKYLRFFKIEIKLMSFIVNILSSFTPNRGIGSWSLRITLRFCRKYLMIISLKVLTFGLELS